MFGGTLLIQNAIAATIGCIPRCYVVAPVARDTGLVSLKQTFKPSHCPSRILHCQYMDTESMYLDVWRMIVAVLWYNDCPLLFSFLNRAVGTPCVLLICCMTTMLH